MAINWSFNANDYQEPSFDALKPGEYRVRIRDAEECVSKNGNDMIKITFDVSGHSCSLWYYLVFMPDNPQMVNQKLGQIFNSFGINPGDLNLENWKGKVGAANVINEMYNGEKQAKIRYFISKEKQASMPAWSEPAGKASVTGGGADFAPVEVSDEDLPF